MHICIYPIFSSPSLLISTTLSILYLPQAVCLCSTSIDICITAPLSPASPTLLAVPYATHYLSLASPIHSSTHTIPPLSHPLPIPYLPNTMLYLSPTFPIPHYQSPTFPIPPSTYPLHSQSHLPIPNPLSASFNPSPTFQCRPPLPCLSSAILYPIFYLSPTFPVPSSNTSFPRSHPPPIPTFTYASLHLLTLLFHHLPIPTPHSSCPIPHPLFYIPTPPLPPHPPLHLSYDPPIFLPLPPPPSPLPHHSNPKICSKPNTTMP